MNLVFRCNSRSHTLNNRKKKCKGKYYRIVRDRVYESQYNITGTNRFIECRACRDT